MILSIIHTFPAIPPTLHNVLISSASFCHYHLPIFLYTSFPCPFPLCCNVLGLLNFPTHYHRSQILVTLRLQSAYLTYIPIAARQGSPASLPRSHHNLLSSSPHPLPLAVTVSGISLCLLCSLLPGSSRSCNPNHSSTMAFPEEQCVCTIAGVEPPRH